MSDMLPVILLLVVLVLTLVALAFLRSRSSYQNDVGTSSDVEQTATTDAAASNTATAQGATNGVRQRRGGLSRMRRAAAAASANGDDDGEINVANGGHPQPATGSGAVGSDGAEQLMKKKKKKEAHREAKREAQAARQAALDAYHEQQQAAEEARVAEEALERAEAEEAEEEARKQAEEEARKQQEEYDNWKNLISVEDAGESVETDQLDDPALLQRFCDYVETEKVVVLENLAAEFDLRTEDVVDRLTRLEENGTLTGFFDDRGKFIYVSLDEMKEVAKLIRKRGRISIQDLATESSKILRLDSLQSAAAV